MKKTLLLSLLLSLAYLTAPCSNRVFSPRLKSLTSTVNSDWQNLPVMTLGSDDVLYVGFDEMSHDARRYVARLVRCEADWTESEEVFETAWLDGINDMVIDDYEHSINTTVDYTHYSLQLPNDQWRLRMSGNYRIDIYDEDGQELAASVAFYVVEQIARISLTATTNTDVDHNDRHQQISMEVNYGSLRVNMPDEEIYTMVMQNWSSATACINPKPTYITPQGLRWEHCRQLIFRAGNEYHKFETLDVSHTTMGIDHISWDGKNYQAFPFASGVRRNYLYDASGNGAFIIRNSDNTEVDCTCDYVWMNYQLQAPHRGDVWIDGQWTNGSDRNVYRMDYDEVSQSYLLSLLQKQGYYSYKYVDENGQAAFSEGDFFQTQNRYQALVYYRATTERTWRLVGYRSLDFR